MSELPDTSSEPSDEGVETAAEIPVAGPASDVGAAGGIGADVRALADAVRSLAGAFRDQRDVLAGMHEQNEANQAAIESLGRRVGELRQVVVDLVEAQHSVIEQLEGGTEQRLEELTKAVSEPIEVDLAPIEQRLDDIRAAVAGSSSASPDAVAGGAWSADDVARLSSLHERLDAIQSALDQPVQVDLGPVVERIDALAEAVDVESMHDLLDRLRGPSVLGALEDRIGRLVKAIPKPGDFDLPALRRQLEAIAGDLADLLDVPPPVDLTSIEARLDALAERVGTPVGPARRDRDHPDNFGDLAAFDDFADEDGPENGDDLDEADDAD